MGAEEEALIRLSLTSFLKNPSEMAFGLTR